MSLSTYPSVHPNRRGVRWRAGAGMFPVKQGSRYLVLRGRMFSASPQIYRSDQKGVIKIQKSKTGRESDFLYYVKNCDIASSMVAGFIELLPTENKMFSISFVAPCVASIEKVSLPSFTTKLFAKLKRKPEKKEYVLVEELISGHLERFIPRNPKILGVDLEYLEAFSHYTFWKSNRQFIVCDFKGVCEQKDFKFTCPSIHSQDKSYGPNDLGEEGISLFFSRHECGKMCEPWAQCVWRNPNLSTHSEVTEQSSDTEELLSPSACSPSSTDSSAPWTALFGDEIDSSGVSTASDDSLADTVFNMAESVRRDRRRTLSDQSGLPPPYSLVVGNSRRPRSNSWSPVLNTQADLHRNSSAPANIMAFNNSSHIDSPPAYESIATARNKPTEERPLPGTLCSTSGAQRYPNERGSKSIREGNLTEFSITGRPRQSQYGSSLSPHLGGLLTSDTQVLSTPQNPEVPRSRSLSESSAAANTQRQWPATGIYTQPIWSGGLPTSSGLTGQLVLVPLETELANREPTSPLYYFQDTNGVFRPRAVSCYPITSAGGGGFQMQIPNISVDYFP